LADRDLLPFIEAEPADQELCRHERERTGHADLLRADCDAAGGVLEASRQVWLEPVESGGVIETAVAGVPGSMEVDRRTLSATRGPGSSGADADASESVTMGSRRGNWDSR
jgi:hypothetical protein